MVFRGVWDTRPGGALERRFTELSRRAAAAGPEPRSYACGSFRLIPSAEEHRAAVRRAVSYIRRGDIFQANICLRLQAGSPGIRWMRSVARSPG